MVCRCKGKEEKLLYLPFIFLSWSFLLSHRWFFFLHLCFQCLSLPFRFFSFHFSALHFIYSGKSVVDNEVCGLVLCSPSLWVQWGNSHSFAAALQNLSATLTALAKSCLFPPLLVTSNIKLLTHSGPIQQKSPRLWVLIQWEMEMLPRNSGNYICVIFITYLEQSGLLFCVSWITPQF